MNTVAKRVAFNCGDTLIRSRTAAWSHPKSPVPGFSNSWRNLKGVREQFLQQNRAAFSSSSQIFQRNFQSSSFPKFKHSTMASSVILASSTKTVGLTTGSKPVTPEISFQGSELPPLEFSGDLLLLAVFDIALDKDNAYSFVDASLAAIDADLGNILSDMAAEEEFKGKVGQSLTARLQGKPFKRISLIGLGSIDSARTSPDAWKSLGGALAATAKQSKAVTASVAILGTSELSDDVKLSAMAAIASGTVVAAFEDSRFKSEFKAPTLTSVAINGLLPPGPVADAALGTAVRLAAGVILTKQLVNSPANVLTPAAMAEVAEAIGFAHSDVLSVKILEQSECEALGMGAYLGVSAASENPPKFIHMQYTPPSAGTDGDKVPTKLAIIGKGLTFDSGGYNIKAGAGSMIELMKFDMGGAGAVLGAAKAIAAIQPPAVEVHFIIAACENMISGSGMRPGDILTASNGRTIEVNNTDAEGRLTLADALVYANKLKVDKILDLATLTGACIVALGNDIAGLFTPQDSMAEELQKAAKSAGEKFWRMPIEESYKEQLKSNIADTVNTGGRAGGSITAALFLKEFVDPETPWAHLDIAGPVWSEKKGGGTGFAVATLVEWVSSQSSAV